MLAWYTLLYLSLHLFNLSLGDTLQNTVHFRHLLFRDDNRGPKSREKKKKTYGKGRRKKFYIKRY